MSQSVLAVELSAGVAMNVRVLRGFSGVNWLVCRGAAGFARGNCFVGRECCPACVGRRLSRPLSLQRLVLNEGQNAVRRGSTYLPARYDRA